MFRRSFFGAAFAAMAAWFGGRGVAAAMAVEGTTQPLIVAGRGFDRSQTIFKKMAGGPRAIAARYR
jgi:hypothetical protein